MSLEKQLQRWTEAGLLDPAAAQRILQFEENAGKRTLRWPAALAVGFGTLMLCAGVLLYVASHWDELSSPERFGLVLLMVIVFHVAAGLLASRVQQLGVALHAAGTVALGAGIFLAAQVFNLEEHWPSGILLWSIGAVAAWAVLRQWPQALLAALLIPTWLASDWSVRTERYLGGPENILAQGLLLLAVLYMSVPQSESNRALRTGLMWAGCLCFFPLLVLVPETGPFSGYRYSGMQTSLPGSMKAIGYGIAYAPALAIAAAVRKKGSLGVFASAAWIAILAAISRARGNWDDPWIYIWAGFGACGLCFWGVQANRKLFINFGIVLFALTVIAFYFSEVLDKFGRSMGLILLGVVFLAGGWVLHRLRSELLARAAARAEKQ